MAITTYTELQTAVANWLERADLTDRIPEFVTLAEAQINGVLRVHQMEARETTTISAEYLALPEIYLDRMSIRISDGGTAWSLEPAPREALDGYPTRLGTPSVFAIGGNELQFYPAPDRPYTATLTFTRSLPPLSEDAPSNWLLALAPDAYLYGTLLQAAVYLRDNEMAQIASDGFNNAIARVRSMHRSMGGKLRTDIPALTSSRTGYDIRNDL